MDENQLVLVFASLAYFKRKEKNDFALKFSTCEYSFAIRKLLICFSNLNQDLFCLFYVSIPDKICLLTSLRKIPGVD